MVKYFIALSLLLFAIVAQAQPIKDTAKNTPPPKDLIAKDTTAKAVVAKATPAKDTAKKLPPPLSKYEGYIELAYWATSWNVGYDRKTYYDYKNYAGAGGIFLIGVKPKYNPQKHLTLGAAIGLGMYKINNPINNVTYSKSLSYALLMPQIQYHLPQRGQVKPYTGIVGCLLLPISNTGGYAQAGGLIGADYTCFGFYISYQHAFGTPPISLIDNSKWSAQNFIVGAQLFPSRIKGWKKFLKNTTHYGG
ncbi:MAG: hypothetical protein EBX41_05395 [Chitinophagia bacterium]|nr:hypothetical protein [Chitinophagia bacterium]